MDEEVKVVTPTTENEGEQVADTEESTTSPADVKTEESRPKKKGGGFQKRIDTLTKEKYELQAQLEAARKTPPKEEKAPNRDDFDDYDSYQQAIAEHTAKRVVNEYKASEEKARKQQEEQKVQAQRVTAWQNHADKVSEKYDDGEDILEFFASEVSLSPVALEAVLESDLGGEIAYYLGKNDAEMERISKLSFTRQAIEIGKLEASISNGSIKQASKASKPIDPVSGRGNVNSKMPQDSDDTETWMKKERARLKAKHS